MRNFIIFTLLIITTTFSFATEKKMSDSPKVKLTTSLGTVVIQLNAEKAPVTTANFLTYVNEGFYNGTIFHRVIKDFMAQGGGFDTSFNQKTTHAPIKNEADNGLKNDPYTIAMARTSNPDSATAQFFINVANNTFLNHTAKTARGWGYAVFGKVIKGQDVVDKIKAVPTATVGPYENVPKEPVTIIKAVVVQE